MKTEKLFLNIQNQVKLLLMVIIQSGLKKNILCMILLFISFKGISMEKKISGAEIILINKIFSIYCDDLKCDENDLEYITFEIIQKNELFEIKIRDTRFDLGGDGYFIIDKNTQEIIKKSYGE